MINAPRHVVMLIDDNEDDRALIEMAFLRQTRLCHLIMSGDGHDALRRLEAARQDAAANPWPDLILLDLNMPGMDGLTLLARVKQDPVLAVVPVVVLTTSRRASDVLACYRLGANAFMAKPAGTRELDLMVEGLLQYWFSLASLPRTELPMWEE